MKRLIVLLLIPLLLSGCGKMKISDVKKDLQNQYDKSKGYYINGELEITNNDEVYQYDVDVYHKKDHYYRVTLTNQANDFRQILLKNDDGVFLYTPSLNKSFKFQSDWPYNHSQIYLFDMIIKDVVDDKEASFKEVNDQFVLSTKVVYPNNDRINKQKIYFDKNYQLKNVIVYDSDDRVIMEFHVNKMKYSPKVDVDYFALDSIVEKDTEEEVKETGVLEDVIYPLFLPAGTKLIDEEKVSKDSGERVIMTYDGEKSFLLVEETQDVFQDFTVIPTSGEPFQLMDTIGVMTENSLSWSSGGTDYYLVSDVMNQQELIEIAQSIVGIPAMK